MQRAPALAADKIAVATQLHLPALACASWRGSRIVSTQLDTYLPIHRQGRRGSYSEDAEGKPGRKVPRYSPFFFSSLNIILHPCWKDSFWNSPRDHGSFGTCFGLDPQESCMSMSTSSRPPFRIDGCSRPACRPLPFTKEQEALLCSARLFSPSISIILRTYSISLHGAEPRPLAGWADNYYLLACAGLNAIDATECYHLDDQTRAGALPEARPASVSSPMLFPGTRPCPDNQH